MQTACRQVVDFHRISGKWLPVSINVSPRQFYQRKLVSEIEAVLAKTGLPPQCLEIEITEGTLIEQTSSFVDILKNLKSLGVKVAIDDFGTGYSSMSYLKHFPIDNLKIDKSFVWELEQDAANQAILKAIVALGHNLGLNVIAEGVETESQRDFLMSIGCDEMQGYLYSKPLPLDAIERLISPNPALV
jgi:EAL domain-containing protein (putative c-di-GMP-specific phosphodiesterase class I)